MTTVPVDVPHLRIADAVPDGRAVPVDLTPVLGTWNNTNRWTRGIFRAELTLREGRLWMRIWAADPDAPPAPPAPPESPGSPALSDDTDPNTGGAAGLRDWGEVPVDQVYSEGPRGARASGYITTFDLGHARTRIEANTSGGVTVLAAFTTFHDDSGRVDYFTREFFHQR